MTLPVPIPMYDLSTAGGDATQMLQDSAQHIAANQHNPALENDRAKKARLEKRKDSLRAGDELGWRIAQRRKRGECAASTGTWTQSHSTKTPSTRHS